MPSSMSKINSSERPCWDGASWSSGRWQEIWQRSSSYHQATGFNESLQGDNAPWQHARSALLHEAQASSGSNSKASKESSTLVGWWHEGARDNAISSNGPVVVSLPAKGEASGKASRSTARRQRRLRQSLTSIGEMSSADHAGELDGKVPMGLEMQEQSQPTKSMARWCNELTAKLEGNAESREQAILSIRNSVWALSTDKLGCRVVQLALRVSPLRVQEEIAAELHGHVRDAIDSPHANYVIQLVVELMPIVRSAFVAEELCGVAANTAKHRYGCRVIIRLLEHYSKSDAHTISLVNELLFEALELARSSFGRYVLQAVLEHGLSEQRRRVVDALHESPDEQENGLLWNAVHRHACCVVEKALEFCSQHDKDRMHRMCRELLGQPDHVLQLAQNQFGFFALRTALSYPGEHVKSACNALRDGATTLQQSKSGRRALEELLDTR